MLLVLGWYDYRLHCGIEKYAPEQGWRRSGDLVREKVVPWGWDGDGIPAWLGAGIFRRVKILQRRALLDQIVFQLREFLVGVERTLLGDAAERKEP